jgi:hypothetical protein
MGFSAEWGPHICSWSGLHITSLRPSITVKIHFFEKQKFRLNVLVELWVLTKWSVGYKV